MRPLLREAGGHRWQRVPPTERKGRVQTSTVTVAVFEAVPETRWVLLPTDIETFTTRDSGAGGQHRNTTDSCVVMRHRPTGIEAKAASKSQHDNRRVARTLLEARVRARLEAERSASKSADRKQQVGTGMRGDKVRTYREQDDQVVDHRTERRARLRDVRRGGLNKLW